MGKKFGSSEWVEEFFTHLNENVKYQKAAKDWEGDFVFVIEPDGSLDHEIRFYLDLWHGQARSFRILSKDESQPSEFVFSGLYSNFLKLFDGSLDPIRGLMNNSFKIIGDMKKVMRSTKAAMKLIETMQSVETDFY